MWKAVSKAFSHLSWPLRMANKAFLAAFRIVFVTFVSEYVLFYATP